ALFAVGINYFKAKTKASADTVLGVFFAFVVALGIVILSRNGGFAKYTSYLIGDVLTVGRADLSILAVLLALTVAYWLAAANPLYLMSINRSLAGARKVNVFWLETSFTVLLGMVVAFSIKLVGILIINSLIILPAAAARVLARDIKSYTFYSVGISLVSSVLGIVSSFYLGTASGGTIVLFAAVIYVMAVIYKKHLGK
ncbi:MAG TPA: metal ABC transporter permease, partial [Candidatus Omnitrophota bacterium]|nr:metal ABC transporter permease [Candidatus Omnitrophota bacterium]